MDEPTEGAEPAKATSPAKPWLEIISDAENAFRLYNDKCDNIDKLYADLKTLSGDRKDREFAIFWANLEVLKPSIYSRAPVPVCVPRYKDFRELPRQASIILERSLATSFDVDDINASMIHGRDDLAINARGAIWLRYEAEGEYDNFSEKVCYDHVERKDFLHEPARKWKEVGWVARRSWLTKKKGVERFGDAWLGAEFTEKSNDTDDEYKGQKKAPVWEIWHKPSRRVVWVSPGISDVLDEQDPWLALEDFFPCPRPAYGTLQRSSLIPVPDFLYYKDQIEEINELTARISSLAESLRVRGFYPSGMSEVGDAVEAALQDTDNRRVLIGVSNWAILGNGSAKDTIVWLPVDQVSTVIKDCVALRRQLIQDVYEITGLSDIMRGSTDAGETATAQQIKAQYGSVRVKDRQAELVRIARDCARMAGEIIAENFQPATLLAMSQVELPTDQDIEAQVQQIMAAAQQKMADPNVAAQLAQNPQLGQQAKQQIDAQVRQLRETVTIDKVVALLRDQKMRPFILDIETDSTIQPDEDAEKQRHTEFLTAFSSSMGQLIPLVQTQPQAAPLVGEMIKFTVKPFRVSRDVDGAIEDFIQRMGQMAQQPKPDPEAEKRKADAEQRQADALMDREKHQAEMAAMREEHALKMQEMSAKIEAIYAKLDASKEMAAIQAESAERQAIVKGVQQNVAFQQKQALNAQQPMGGA